MLFILELLSYAVGVRPDWGGTFLLPSKGKARSWLLRQWLLSFWAFPGFTGDK